MRKISITRDTRLALTTEAAGSLSNSEKCPTLDTFSRVIEAQANKWSQKISALQMDTHLKIEGKNDIRRLSVGNQGP